MIKDRNYIRRIQKNFLLVIIPVFILTHPVHANREDTIKLGEVQVFSSILDIRQRQSGRSVTVITAEQLHRMPVSNIDEVIRFIPGVETQSRNLFGVQTDYSIRGSTFNQVLVMIDGIRLNDPLTGHFNSYIPVPLSEISRIEVIRGPATVMFGPDAVGGVIHIVTKNYTPISDSTFNLNLSAGGGEHNLVYSDAGISSSFHNWKIGSGIKYIYSAGYPDWDGIRDDFRLITATASSSVKFGRRNTLSFRTAIDSREFSARRFYTISPYDTAREKVRNWWNHAGLIHMGDKSVIHIDAAYKAGEDSYRFNSWVPVNEHTTEQFVFQLRKIRTLSNSLRFSAGFHGNYRAIQSIDRGNHDEFYGGLYSLAFIEFPSDLYFSGGARIEFDKFNRAVFLPQANISWLKEAFTIRALVGRTIRTPDFTERYVSTNLPFLSSGRNLGNPLLTSEKSWSFETGSDIHLPGNLNTGLTLFCRKGSRLIDYVYTPAAEIPSAVNLDQTGSYFFAQNMRGFITGGVEITINGLHRFREEIFLEYHAGYVMQESFNTSVEFSKYFSGQARQLFTLFSLFKFNRAGIGLNTVIKQRNAEYAELIQKELKTSYQVINIRVMYMILPEIMGLEIKLDNLFNTEYSDILGAELPGRWISGGLKIDL